MTGNSWSYGKGQDPVQSGEGGLVQLPDGSMGTLAQLVASLGQQQQDSQKQKNYVPASLQAMVRQQGGFGGYRGR